MGPTLKYLIEQGKREKANKMAYVQEKMANAIYALGFASRTLRDVKEDEKADLVDQKIEELRKVLD